MAFIQHNKKQVNLIHFFLAFLNSRFFCCQCLNWKWILNYVFTNTSTGFCKFKFSITISRVLFYIYLLHDTQRQNYCGAENWRMHETCAAVHFCERHHVLNAETRYKQHRERVHVTSPLNTIERHDISVWPLHCFFLIGLFETSLQYWIPSCHHWLPASLHHLLHHWLISSLHPHCISGSLCIIASLTASVDGLHDCIDFTNIFECLSDCINIISFQNDIAHIKNPRSRDFGRHFVDQLTSA